MARAFGLTSSGWACATQPGVATPARCHQRRCVCRQCCQWRYTVTNLLCGLVNGRVDRSLVFRWARAGLGLGWAELGGVGIGCYGLGWVVLGWARLGWIVPEWGGLSQEGDQCCVVGRSLHALGLPAEIGGASRSLGRQNVGSLTKIYNNIGIPRAEHASKN